MAVHHEQRRRTRRLEARPRARRRPAVLVYCSRAPAIILLAYLVLADGQLVRSDELGALIYPHNAFPQMELRHLVARLRRAGIRIETGARGMSRPTIGRARGYRLRALPPDELLDELLLAIDAIKARYWRPKAGAVEAWLDAADVAPDAAEDASHVSSPDELPSADPRHVAHVCAEQLGRTGNF
jgi:hypothetical protein